MPKFPKPWHRRGRGWFVTLDGKQIPLGADREEAFAAYHRLMQQPAAVPKRRSDTVGTLVDQFLDWVRTNRAPDTFEWYQSRLQLFLDRYPDLTIRQLKPFHVQRWIDSCSHLKSGSKRNYCRAIQRALKWAEQQGLIDDSPIAHFQKPRAGRRETVISPEEYQRILEQAPCADFRDLVSFAWETGARAAECMAIERRHVELDHARIVFPVQEEKMQRAPRIIYLSEAALKIVRRRVLLPHNWLFVNSDGARWTPRAVNCGFCAIRVRMGKELMRERQIEISEEDIRALIPKLCPKRLTAEGPVAKTRVELKVEARRKLQFRMAGKLAPKYCLTAFRHSWCHRALRRGVDALTVSVLMGHADPSMVARVYSHLSHATDYLQEAVNRAAVS